MVAKRAGQIVLFKFPHSDLTSGKLRPAVLLAPLPNAYSDWLICMLSSQVHQAVKNIDEVIAHTDPDFSSSGLKSTSVIRATRLAVVNESIFVGRLGEISAERLQRIRTNIAHWIAESV